jgi:hypothetical protein
MQPQPQAPRAPVFDTPIPSDLLPPLGPREVPPPPESDATVDEQVWTSAPEAGQPLAGDAVVEDVAAWIAEMTAEMAAEAADGEAAAHAAGGNGVEVVEPPAGGPEPDQDGFVNGWAAVRDANIRPYVDWRPVPPVPLPVIAVKPAPSSQPQGQRGGGRPHHHHQQPPHPPRRPGPGPNGGGNGGGGGGGKRRKRRGRNRPERERDFNRRERGPRLPGFYNPGGD